MSTLDTAALWSATTLAFDDKKISAAGLSVRQRKLLSLLARPSSIAELAHSIALPSEEVHATLQRFAKLGLAKPDESLAPAPPINPMHARMSTNAAATATATSRLPMLIGLALGAIALVGGGLWLMRGGAASTGTNAAASAQSSRASPSATGNSAGPGDSAELPNLAATRTLAAAQAGAPIAGANAASTGPASAGLVATNKDKARDAVAPAANPAAAAGSSAATKAGTGAQGAAPNAAALQPTAPVAGAAPTASATTTGAALSAAPAASPAVATGAPAPATAAPPASATNSPAVTQPTAPAAAAAPAATVATAAPGAARPASREIKLISRVDPPFPRGFDADRGSVRARLQVDSRGVVTGVDIVESVPPRVFDRTVRSALQQWRYEPTGEAFSTMAEISFNR